MKPDDNGFKEHEVKFRVPPKFLEKFDRFWADGGYANRSIALRDAMRRTMKSK